MRQERPGYRPSPISSTLQDRVNSPHRRLFIAYRSELGGVDVDIGETHQILQRHNLPTVFVTVAHPVQRGWGSPVAWFEPDSSHRDDPTLSILQAGTTDKRSMAHCPANDMLSDCCVELVRAIL